MVENFVTQDAIASSVKLSNSAALEKTALLHYIKNA